jgi:hypothetical protein
MSGEHGARIEQITHSDQLAMGLRSIETGAHDNLAEHHPDERIILDASGEDGDSWTYEVTRTRASDDPTAYYPTLNVTHGESRQSYVWLDGETVGYADQQTGARTFGEPERAEEMANTLAWMARTMREQPQAWRVHALGQPATAELDGSMNPVEQIWGYTNDIYVATYGAELTPGIRTGFGDILEYQFPGPDGTLYRRQFGLTVVPDNHTGVMYQPSVVSGFDGRERAYQLMSDGNVIHWDHPNAQGVAAGEAGLKNMTNELYSFLSYVRQYPGSLLVNGQPRT